MDEPLIMKSNEIMSGTPVFYGTRVPVRNLIDYLSGGDSIEIFLEDFPSVSREQVLRFLESAEILVTAQSHANSD